MSENTNQKVLVLLRIAREHILEASLESLQQKDYKTYGAMIQITVEIGKLILKL